ncbi:class I adenylate-forming enzyme family protein [Aeromicrobium sp. UC242_57]|uniref:class I adenylate-forming enzyme family protein n=1 Tax=Aeromicrobium sp. UC242_57 TaxID=3374624 RepID=UPI0037A20599
MTQPAEGPTTASTDPAAAPTLAEITNLGDITRLHATCTDRLAFIDLRDPETPAGYSYPEVAHLVSAAATDLRSRSFEPGARIGIMSANRVEYVIAYLGIMQAGLVAVPINIKSGSDVLDHIVRDASVAMTFVDHAGRKALAGRSSVIDFDDPHTPYLQHLLAAAPAPAGPGPAVDVAEMLYTSGSSGVPEGVPLTHEGQLWALRTISAEAPRRIETQIIAQPLFHMNGLITLCRGIALGFTTIICPRFEASAYVAAIENYSVTTVAAVPTMWIRAMREVGDDPSKLSSVRSLSLGSAPITVEQVARISEQIPAAQVIVSYGTTESGPAIFGAHPRGLERPPLALGHPLDGSEVKLVGGPDDDHGVLMMRNPAVTSGYHQLPEPRLQSSTTGGTPAAT